MRGLREILLKEYDRLGRIRQKLVKELQNVPEGTLRITKSNKATQYFHHTKTCFKGNGKYIPKSNQGLIHQLAQKSYDQKIQTLVDRRLHQLEILINEYHDDEIEAIYKRQQEERKRWVIPVEPTWEQILNEWIDKEYTGKGFKENDVSIYTEKGERVRSKSEKIIADYFFRNKIPYKYEKPLMLKGYGIVYPDFTLLSGKTNKEIYWEHQGRMDDPAYANAAINKIKTYEENGIFVGERLILTFETQSSVLNTGEISRIVERIV
ncbi:MAG: hypothetical protein ACI4EW_10935 [Butyrivibrio sp.]